MISGNTLIVMFADIKSQNQKFCPGILVIGSDPGSP